MGERPITLDHLTSNKKPATKKLVFTLDPDLSEEVRDLRSQVKITELRLEGAPNSEELKAKAITAQEELDAALERLRENCVEFHFRAVRREAFEDLVMEHRPTEEQQERDKEAGGSGLNWNPDTFPPALISASLTEPLLTAEEVAILFKDENWAASETQAMFLAALDVNSNRRIPDLGKG